MVSGNGKGKTTRERTVNLEERVKSYTPAEAGKRYVEYQIIEWGKKAFSEELKKLHAPKISAAEYKLLTDYMDDLEGPTPSTKEEIEEGIKNFNDFTKWTNVKNDFAKKWEAARYRYVLALYASEAFLRQLDDLYLCNKSLYAVDVPGNKPAATKDIENLLDAVQPYKLESLKENGQKANIDTSLRVFTESLRWLTGYTKAIDLVAKCYGLNVLKLYKRIAGIAILADRAELYNKRRGIIATDIKESKFGPEEKERMEGIMDDIFPLLDSSSWTVPREQVIKANKILKGDTCFSTIGGNRTEDDFFQVMGVL